jgi:hypothetical protein
MNGEAVSADTVAAEEFPNLFCKINEEGGLQKRSQYLVLWWLGII